MNHSSTHFDGQLLDFRSQFDLQKPRISHDLIFAQGGCALGNSRWSEKFAEILLFLY